MNKITLAGLLMAAVAATAVAQTVAFDGQKIGTTVAAAAPAPTAAANPVATQQDFRCTALERFGALNVAVSQQPDTVQVKLYGWNTARAASDLGLAGNGAANMIQVDFPKSWCIVSASNFGVLSCEVKDTWPRQTIEAQAFKDGQVVGSGKLSVYYFQIERTRRISAGVGGDFEQEFLELSANMISDADNQKRAELGMRYTPRDCRATQ